MNKYQVYQFTFLFVFSIGVIVGLIIAPYLLRDHPKTYAESQIESYKRAETICGERNILEKCLDTDSDGQCVGTDRIFTCNDFDFALHKEKRLEEAKKLDESMKQLDRNLKE